VTRGVQRGTDRREDEDIQTLYDPPTPRAKLSRPIELKFCMVTHRRVLFEIVEAILKIPPQGRDMGYNMVT
jgi:hypothetical protein